MVFQLELWWIRQVEGQIKQLNNSLTKRGKVKKKHQDKLESRNKINQENFTVEKESIKQKKTLKRGNIKTQKQLKLTERELGL